MDKTKIKEAIIVEGRYDKIKLESVIDAYIIQTFGFAVFKNDEQMRAIKTIAQNDGVIIMTDSDSAGLKIRYHINQRLLSLGVPESKIKHAYIPEIYGKEKRKDHSGAEGLLGVEGMDAGVIVEALEKAGCKRDDLPDSGKISKQDLFEDGLWGRDDSSSLRKAFAQSLNLPGKISVNMLIKYLNRVMTYEEYKDAVSEIKRLMY